MWEPFSRALATRHHYAREWKGRTGGKVVGYFCTYVPEEVLYAAGILPVRILGSHQPQDLTEPHIFGIFCPFCRDCLAQGLGGAFDYLEGIVKARSCMHMRNAFAAWRRHLPVPFSYYMGMPAVTGAAGAQEFLTGELAAFKAAVEGWLGKAVTSADLARAIEVYNTTRRLLRQLYELRREEAPPLSGAEAMEVVLASQVMDKAEYNRLLADLLAWLPRRPNPPSPGVRLILVGTENDDTELLRLIESLGGLVVADDHCSGSRYFANEALGDGDALSCLARRYLERTPCPAKDLAQRRRVDHVLGLAREYRVQGAVILQQKFCEPMEYEVPILQRRLREAGIPSLLLEYDLALVTGPFRSRIEAFLEMLELE